MVKNAKKWSSALCRRAFFDSGALRQSEIEHFSFRNGRRRRQKHFFHFGTVPAQCRRRQVVSGTVSAECRRRHFVSGSASAECGNPPVRSGAFRQSAGTDPSCPGRLRQSAEAEPNVRECSGRAPEPFRNEKRIFDERFNGSRHEGSTKSLPFEGSEDKGTTKWLSCDRPEMISLFQSSRETVPYIVCRRNGSRLAVPNGFPGLLAAVRRRLRGNLEISAVVQGVQG